MHIKSELVNDDWERLYINGDVVLETHRITARQLMNELKNYGVTVEFTEIKEDD